MKRNKKHNSRLDFLNKSDVLPPCPIKRHDLIGRFQPHNIRYVAGLLTIYMDQVILNAFLRDIETAHVGGYPFRNKSTLVSSW